MVVGLMSVYEGTVADIAEGLAWALYVIPQFAFGFGFINIALVETYGYLNGETYTPLSKKITGYSLIYMAVCGFVYFIAVLVLER